MGYEYATESQRTTTSSSVDVGAGSSLEGENSSAILGMESPECGLGDDTCEYAADLDDILGEGAYERIDTAIGTLSRKSFQGAAACAAAGDAADVYLAHFDGSANLAGLLDDTAVRLMESAEVDEAGEVSWDGALEDVVVDLEDRVQLANEVLDAVLLLVDQDHLVALGSLVSQIGAFGVEKMEGLRIRAETGEAMFRILTKSFQEHQGEMEDALKAASKDTVSLLLGPLTTLLALPDVFKRVWSLSNAFNKIGTEPEGLVETVKTVKTIGFAAAGEVARTLATTNPFRVWWTPVSTLVNTCQTIIDLGDAATELTTMKMLLDQAIAVRDEYGPVMAFYDANESTIVAALALFERLSGASERVDAALTAADELVTTVGDPAAFYYQA